MKALIFAMISIVSTLVIPSAWAELPEQPHIIVQAEGIEYTLPDQVTLTLTLEHINPHLSKARDNVERRSEQLLKAVRRFNLDDRDIEAGQVRIQPEYRWENNRRIQTGTRVSRMMQLRIRDLSEYPDILDALFSANTDSLTQVAFSHSQADSLQQQALLKAITAARSKAEKMAGQLGQSIGKAYRIEELGHHNAMPIARKEMVMMAADRSATPETDYQPGEIAFKSQVQVIFYLR